MNQEKENLTKQYIFQAFNQLLKTTNYDNISVCDITKKAGVSRMSFYRNFKSKEDLAYKGIQLVFDKIHKRLEESEEKSQYICAKIVFEEFMPAKDLLQSFKNSNLAASMIDIIEKKLKEDVPNDYMNKTSKYIPVFYFGAIASTLLCWLNNGAEETPDEMAKLIATHMIGV